MTAKEWYFEYVIHNDRPGLLGDISSLLGMLSINIITINGVDKMTRGMLLRSSCDDQVARFRAILETIEDITVAKVKKPNVRDRLAVRHGRFIERDSTDKNIYKFVRAEVGLLVDFMAELFKKEGHFLIGVRGMPRIGKTESIVAASVSASKRWVFLSSTLLRQTVRNKLEDEEMKDNHIYIIDGIVTTKRATKRHQTLVRDIMRQPSIKVVEHPDVFVQGTEYTLADFDCIIELRNDESDEMMDDESDYSPY